MKRIRTLWLPQPLPAAILLMAFLIAMPSGALWRDTGEFIISAFYLDIAHPAGFPLFSQITNIGTLLPLGPIAWRVHLISLAYLIAYLYLSQKICESILKHFFNIDKTLRIYLSVLPGLISICAPVVLKQVFSSEVYVLNCIGIQCLAYLFIKTKVTNDLRYLLVAAFLAGLFAGNHATIVLSYPAALLLVLLKLKKYKKIILPGFLFSIMGLCIYLYIPTRSQQFPPLNTGRANTFERVINLVTNKRDRVLTDFSVTFGENIEKEALASLVLRFSSDMQKLAEQTSSLVLLAAIPGVILLLFQSTSIGFLFVWIFISHWYFFKGWQADPWIPLIWIVGTLASISLSLLLQTLADLVSKKLVYGLSTVVAAILVYKTVSVAFIEASYAKNYLLPTELSKKQLANMPADSVIISERSWFLHAYSHYIDGYRPDLTLTYIKQITNPQYFAPLELSYNEKTIFSSNDIGSIDPYKNLTSFVSAVSKERALVYEPGNQLNTFFAPVSILTKPGISLIRYGEKASVSDTFLKDLILDLKQYYGKAENNWPTLRWEAFQYLDSITSAHGNALSTQELNSQAIDLYKSVCPELQCNSVLVNNLALEYLQIKDYNQATGILESLLDREVSKSHRQSILKNLDIAYKHQTSR